MRANKKKLGQKIKSYRESADRKVEETADAIELDKDTLVQIEAGEIDVDEEILALLMSHFNLKEKSAFELWELAGYDMGELINITDMPESNKDNNEEKKEVRINMSADLKVLYSDMVQVSSNKYGVTVQFIQSAPGSTAQVVSRIGMSKEHAQSFIDILQKNIGDKKG